MKRMIDFLRTQPMLSCILGLVIGVASIKILPAGTSLQEGVVRMLLTATMAFFLYFISGEKTLQACDNETGYVLKVAAPMLIVSILFGGFSLIGSAFTLPLRQDWLFELLSTIYMCLFVGLFEELCFRAIINDALVYQFRNFKYVFVVSAIFSSIIFGYVHVLGITPDTPAILAQIIGKTVSTALFGFALLILYWKTRNIWACGLSCYVCILRDHRPRDRDHHLEEDRQEHRLRRDEKELVIAQYFAISIVNKVKIVL